MISSFKREADGCIGWEGKKKKKKKEKESDDHLVAAFFFSLFNRRYKNRPQDLQPDQGSLLCPRKSFPANSEVEQKASPVVEDEEG